MHWLSNDSAQICTSIIFSFRARTMKQLSTWPLIGPLKVFFLDKVLARPLTRPEVRSSTILDSSSLRMSNHGAMVRQWNCSSTYLLRTRTMKQLSIWSLICPLKVSFLYEEQAKSIILNYSSVRTSTHCAMVMQWKCSDMHHHWLIFCWLKPWSSYLSGTWSVH